MFTNDLRAHYHNRYRADVSHVSIKSIRSFINSTPNHQRKSPEFISDLTQRLYLLHEHNCRLAKRLGKYPKSRNLDWLLVKYIELEFECLYQNSYPREDVEITTESRVLHLLKTMLNQAVQCSKSRADEDVALKKAILQLLGKLRTEYLAKNKLVDNILLKLLEINKSDSKTSSVSGYGSDDSDSGLQVDFRNSGYKPERSRSSEDNADNTVILSSDSEDEIRNKCDNTSKKKSDGVVTFEILDDDDNQDLNYMVYLEKETKTNKKRKKEKRIIEEIIVCSDSENEDVKLKTERVDSCVEAETDQKGDFGAFNPQTDLLNDINAAFENPATNYGACKKIEAITEKESPKEYVEISKLMLNFLVGFTTFYDLLDCDQSSKTEQVSFMTKPYNQMISRDASVEFMHNVDNIGGPVLAERTVANVVDDKSLEQKEFEQHENYLFYESQEKL